MDVTGVISAGVTDTDASNCNTAADDRPGEQPRCPPPEYVPRQEFVCQYSLLS
jgi:hypothetical protein